MANIDVSSYFFTAAVPVCNEGIVEHDGIKSSPIHVVREVLETLPTALQSHATEEIGLNSPFSRNLRTHFTRFVILDQPYFNGRDHSDALVNAIRGTNLLEPQPVDQITCPYIFWTIDFDLLDPSGAGEPRRYLEELWGQMEPELRSIFQYCYDFDTVTDAASFASYIQRCQIETTMPFHDYWYVPPKLSSISILGLALLPGAGALMLLASLAAWILRWTGWAWAAGFAGWSGWAWMPWAGLALLVLGLVVDYYWVLWKGRQPYPAAPGSDLRNVLKALYLQQAFTRFAIAQQHRDPAEWGAAFRAFLTANRPGDLDGPTQPAGVIRSKLPGDAA
ncbi:hypothetical protein ACNFJ7_05690 [Sphingomonas sp. HT-1]|uniref:hypothetical protein n=1 Tax=unclassified Sphingomonas TaxID=196159 RepID=UPI0003018941|nr:MULTISPECIES: hypothetical protein [unclassified Sphingomonas]KTF68509.1 hypothetical protein ATB93_13600 [Sphingomonas sp. WG]